MADFDLTQSGQEIQNILDGAAMQTDLTAEIERAEQAEQQLQGNIDIEETRAKAAEKQNADDIDIIEGKIPAAASNENQLADKAFVNSSIATATATYRGAYNLVSDLHLTIDATEQQIAAALAGAISTADNNDYCFVQISTAVATPTQIAAIERYKFNGTAWAYEYTLNNSGFTADQWAALNSGITTGLVAKLAALPTNDELTLLLGGKQDVLTFDNVPTEGSNNPVKSGGVKSAIDSEKERAQGAEQANAGNIAQVIAMIPAAASSENQLADKNFVNSSIATNTGTYRGAYNEVSDLSLSVDATHEQIAAALAEAISTADNNDYCFVQIPTADATPTQIAAIERYKFNGTAWAYEYTLNNSGYTAEQWAAINSGITSGLVAKLAALPTNDDLVAALAGKQPMLTFDNVPTESSTNPVKSGGVYAAIAEEAGTRAAAIAAIVALIPSAASALNQLADKAFVNSSISTATAVFKGTFNVVADLELNYNASQAQIALMLGSKIVSADNNDYCFVQIPTSNETPLEIARTDRYKYNSTAWAYEYTLNNSGFTAAQWAAINSGITSLLKDKLIDLPTATELATQLAAKQNVLTFDTTPTEGSTNPVTSDGIHAAINVEKERAEEAEETLQDHIDDEKTRAQGAEQTLQTNIDLERARALAAEQDLLDEYNELYALYQTLQGGTIIPVAAADWPVSNPQQNVIYRVANSATPTAYSDYMYNGTNTILLADFTFPGIDSEPTPDSTNLVTSGGTFDAIMQNGPAFDLSAYNAVGGTLATYADLSAALTALNALPAAYKKGGMSIKYVQTYDNKYVQWRLIKNQWSVDVKDWINDSENVKNLINEVGEFLLCDKVVSYSADPSAWESTRRFVDISYDFMADSSIKYKNECAYTAYVRVTYSDNSQVIYDIPANSEGTISIEHNNLVIKVIFCYFAASDHAENNIKLIALQRIGKRLNDVELLAQKTAPALGYANGTVFVSCDNADWVNRFFKELYIIPIYPDLFVNAVAKITIYRGWNDASLWSITFQSSDDVYLASIQSSTNIESQEILKILPSSSNNKFYGYAIVDWSQMPTAPSRIYGYSCTLNNIATDLKYSPVISAWLNRNNDIYKLPNWEYESLESAALDVKQMDPYDMSWSYDDRKIKGLMLRFYNTTTKNVELWIYNYTGSNPEYHNNFVNQDNWILVDDGLVRTEPVPLVEPQLVKKSEYLMNASGLISYESGEFTQRIRYAKVKRGDIIKVTMKNNYYSSLTVRMTMYSTVPDDGSTKISDAELASTPIASGATTILTYKCKFDGYFCLYGYGLDHSEYFDNMSYTIEYCRTIKDIVTLDAPKWDKTSQLVSEPTNEMIIASHEGLAISGRTIGSPRAWLYASQFGYKWMECDIQFTSDNVAVFLHDEPINANGNYIVNKSTGVPVASSDNLKVKNLTLSQLQGTYRWADGGNILTLVEGFGLLNMLGMNCRLEFKAVPSNKAQKDYLKNACMQFGIGRIVYNATSTPYETIFDMLVELGIYKKGTIAVAASTVDDDKVENAFKYAQELGNAAVGVYSPNGIYTLDSVFIQNMLSKYGVRWSDGQWGKNTKYQTVEIVSNYIAPCLEHYANTELLVNGDDIDYNDYMSIGTFTLQSDANVNICMIADSDVSIKINTKDDEFYGNTNIAICLASGTYALLAKGAGHITELMIRF